MRALRGSFLIAAAALLLGACGEDPFGRADPLVATDTFQIAAPLEPQAVAPSALDITAQAGFIRGGRHPERPADAEQWELVLAAQGGALVFLPPGALGFESRAGISAPLDGVTFEGLRDVPAGTRFVTDSAVSVQQGAIYAVRSRQWGFGGCVQYAKMQPMEVDVAAGTVRLQIATNERCFDTRLVNPGS